MDESRFKHTSPKQPAARQLVDSFVVAAPKPALQPKPVQRAQPLPARHAPAMRRPIDGFLPAGQPVAQPRPVPSRQYAQGPLHLKYQQPTAPIKRKPVDQPKTKPQPQAEVHTVRPRMPGHIQQPSAEPREVKSPKRVEPIPSKQYEIPQEELDELEFESANEQEIIQKITQPLPAKKTVKERAKKAAKLSGWALVGLIVLGGLSLFSQAVGELALAVYAVVALWRRWPSQQTFALALMMFVGIILASSLSSVTAFPALNDITQTAAFEDIGRNLAVYAFLLLCIGTFSLAREVRRDSKHDVTGKTHHA